MHSIKQCNKVLRFMGLSYEMLMDDRAQRRSHAALSYRENTSVFAYYVETAVLLSAFPSFLSFCHQHNINMFDFRKTPHNMRRYTNMYASIAVSSDTRSAMSCVAGNVDSLDSDDSLRMSCFEIGA